MAVQVVCPRCGARDSFMKGYLPETCVCRLCQSQLDWREIPGCGPDCRAVEPEPAPESELRAPTYVASTAASSATDALAAAARRLKADALKATESTGAATPTKDAESAEIAEEEDTESKDAAEAGEHRAARERGDEGQ